MKCASSAEALECLVDRAQHRDLVDALLTRALAFDPEEVKLNLIERHRAPDALGAHAQPIRDGLAQLEVARTKVVLVGYVGYVGCVTAFGRKTSVT
jgi:hypothetical protein